MPVVGIWGYVDFFEGGYYGAFEGYSILTSVTIPDSVTSILVGAFAWCSGLNTAYFNGNAPLMGSDVFYDCASNFSICYTAGATGFTTPTWYGYPHRCVCRLLSSISPSSLPRQMQAKLYCNGIPNQKLTMQVLIFTVQQQKRRIRKN